MGKRHGTRIIGDKTMYNPIWLFFYNFLRHYRGHIVFISSLIIVSSAGAKPAIFTMSDDEIEQAKYQKWVEIQSRQVQTLEIDSNTNLLQEQTFVDWQNGWMDMYFDNFYFGKDSYPYWIMAGLWGETDNEMPFISNINGIFQNTRDTKLINFNFANTTSNQLEEVIGKLDKLAGDDGSGNANINVNFQPLQQVLTDINDNVDISRQRLSQIEMETYSIENHTKIIEMATGDTVLELIDANKTLSEGFETNNRNLQTANNTLAHIDEDLHQIKGEGLKIDWEAGGGTNYLDQVIGKHFDKLTEDMERIAEEQTQPEKLDGEYMDDAYDQEQGAYYVMNTMLGAKEQLQSELSSLQYTNINAKVYDYDEYNNYYSLEGYEANPMSNDQFIREKVQQYIDQVTYTTETIKGQVTTRLDELKQSTLLTTDYDPKWLVVKKGALSEKHSFPDKDWEVDLSQIKLESNIAKTIYDWIYYLLAVVIIYKQFSKVV